ncbi:MAG: tetratricopeptide repeat protein [Ignavibacteria bacterium]|nr:tetratricopeptide repeat protein [Ignavibacteria bacterium]
MRNMLKLFIFLIFPLSSVSQESFSSWNEKGNNSLENQNYPEALSFFMKAIEIGTENKADLIWTAATAAICAQQINDTTKAIFFFETALKNDCKDEDIHERYLKLAQQQKDLDKEEFILKQARKNVTDANNKYTIKLLNFYFNNNLFEKAIQLADEPLSASLNQGQIVIFKAISLTKTGKSNEAIQLLEKFIDNNPDSFEALKQMGLICYDVALTTNTKAKSDYKNLKKPSWDDYNNFLIKEKKSAEQFKKALPFLEKAYQIKADETLKNTLYNTYIKLGNKGKASLYK